MSAHWCSYLQYVLLQHPARILIRLIKTEKDMHIQIVLCLFFFSFPLIEDLWINPTNREYLVVKPFDLRVLVKKLFPWQFSHFEFLLQNLSVITNLFPLAEADSLHLVHFALNNCLKWCNKRTSDVQRVLIIPDWGFRVWWACSHKVRLTVILFIFFFLEGACLWKVFRHPLLKERKKETSSFFLCYAEQWKCAHWMFLFFSLKKIDFPEKSIFVGRW